jgi:phage terminase Nu1 subunit (DNA packaging protein)
VRSVKLAPSGRSVAVALGVSPGRVSQLKAQGMPTDTVGAAQEWYAANVDKKYAPTTGKRQTASLEDARVRRETAEANMAEMRELAQAGELVDAVAVRRLLSDAGAQIGLILDRIPDRLAPRLVAGGNEQQIHQMLQAEIDQVRAELAAVTV